MTRPSRRLRELCGRHRLPPKSRLALHHPVNALGTPDIRHAQPRHPRLRSQAVNLLVRGHQRKQIVDALFRRQARIVERIMLQVPLIHFFRPRLLPLLLAERRKYGKYQWADQDG
jgi:hypothetical protein